MTSSALHVGWHGDRGPPLLLLHGSFVRPAQVWARQLALADEFRVGIVERRGYGRSPDVDRVDFERDGEDIADLLDEPAHLVGHSYGGICALFAAAGRPDGVRSLTVLEPPALGLAPADPAARELRDRLQAVFDRGDDPQALYGSFFEAWGYERPSAAWLARQDERALVSSSTERPPWEAVFPFDHLRAARFPKLVVSGDWSHAPAAARDLAGRAYAAVCDVLERRLDAERLVVPHAAHLPQLTGQAFNEPLRAFLHRADARRHAPPASA